jgi:hypothetical protein
MNLCAPEGYAVPSHLKNGNIAIPEYFQHSFYHFSGLG